MYHVSCYTVMSYIFVSCLCIMYHAIESCHTVMSYIMSCLCTMYHTIESCHTVMSCVCIMYHTIVTSCSHVIRHVICMYHVSCYSVMSYIVSCLCIMYHAIESCHTIHTVKLLYDMNPDLQVSGSLLPNTLIASLRVTKYLNASVLMASVLV